MRVVNKWSKTVVITAMLFLAGMVIGCGSKKEESYRSIQVYDIDGTGWVTREEVGEMELYTNMQLQSHDQLRTDSDSYVQLKLDEDKYVLLEPNTRIRIIAEGNAQDSRTKIVLEEGAVVNRIENKLSDNSSYEVEAPNSTMAVRGTTFRVTTWEDENGNLVSEIEVQEGNVDCSILIKNTDGTVSEKVVSLEKGKKIIINGTLEGVDSVTEPMEYTYDIYENPVLTFIGYSEEKDQETEETDDRIGTETEEEDSEKTEDNQEDKKQENDTQVIPKEEIPKEETPKEEPPKEEAPKEELPKEETPKEESSGNSGSSSGSTDSGNSGSSSGSTDSGTTGGGESTGGTTGGDSGTDTTSYTVTFTYNGTFATQTVTEGGTATAPLLMPTSAGTWCDAGGNSFDFSTTITSDTTLYWTDASAQTN